MSELYSKLPRGVDLPMPVGSDEAKMFAGPVSLDDREVWRSQLGQWKLESASRIKYDDSLYSSMKYKTFGSFNVALIWLWDELLFDFDAQEFTPEKLIDDCKKFGGVDGIILWHAYPVIGLDSRNQFDFYNQVDGLAELVNKLHEFGVKVYLNYNPWDRWTRRPSNPDQNELASLIQSFDFDGVFLDTMKSADPLFMEPILKVKPDVIVAGESRVQQERICDHVMSWAQWFGDSEIPGVIRAKWFEPRHMLHQTRRWNRSHIEELHIAWLNGAGMLLWEVVFGSWVGWNNKEKQMWKEMVQILRTHSQLLVDGSWEPLTKLSDQAEDQQLYGSKFSKGDSFLITIINKSNVDFSGEIAFGISGLVPAKGVTALLKDEKGLRTLEFTYQKENSTFNELKARRLKELVGDRYPATVTFRNRECGLYDGAPFVDAWKPLPPNFHQIFSATKSVLARKGKLSLREITNAQYLEFIRQTGYSPKSSARFLQHWNNGVPNPQDLEKPVTFVDLDDAKAFATWAGSVIPTEWEWQRNSHEINVSEHVVWNLTDSVHTDGRTRFLILKGGSYFNLREGQGAKSTSGIAESDWYVDGGRKDADWIEKLLLMGKGMSRSENIGFRCFTPEEE